MQPLRPHRSQASTDISLPPPEQSSSTSGSHELEELNETPDRQHRDQLANPIQPLSPLKSNQGGQAVDVEAQATVASSRLDKDKPS